MSNESLMSRSFRSLILFSSVFFCTAQSEAEYPRQVYWGDTHVHTALSGDAFNGGVRLKPEDAYRFARGEAVVATSGQTAQLERPLDFLVLADHANNIGAAFYRQEYLSNPHEPVHLVILLQNQAADTSIKAQQHQQAQHIQPIV